MNDWIVANQKYMPNHIWNTDIYHLYMFLSVLISYSLNNVSRLFIYTLNHRESYRTRVRNAYFFLLLISRIDSYHYFVSGWWPNIRTNFDTSPDELKTGHEKIHKRSIYQDVLIKLCINEKHTYNSLQNIQIQGHFQTLMVSTTRICSTIIDHMSIFD